MNRNTAPMLAAMMFGLAAFALSGYVQAAGACASGCSGKSALECAAEGLAAGEWCAFDTTDNAVQAAQRRMNYDSLETCSSCCPRWTWTYTDSLAWWRGPTPSGNGRILFEGSPHNGSSIVMRYDEATNTWSRGTGHYSCGPQMCTNNRLSSPSTFRTGCSNARHGYDHNAIDPSTGKLFYLKGKVGGRSGGFIVYDPDTDTWSDLPPSPLGLNWAISGLATKYFPEWNVNGATGAFIVIGHTNVLQAFDPDTNSWSDNLGGISFENVIHFAMEYDARNGVMWLMDGESRGGGSKHYRLERNGNIVPLQSLNGSAKPDHFGTTALVVGNDSASGRFLVWDCDGGGAWYEYDIMRDLWRELTHSMPPVNSENGCNGNVAEVSISNYGVIGFLVATQDSKHTLYLYRHAETDIIPPRPPSGVTAE